jgi:hypothetical protein
VPKSATTPSTAISTRRLTPRAGWLFGPEASMVTADCDTPSW